MKGNEPRYSRVNRKKMRSRSNQLLNIMIGLVVLLIIIVGASIIVGNNDDEAKESTAGQEEVEDEGSAEDELQSDESDAGVTDEEEDSSGTDTNDKGQDGGQSSDSGEEPAESVSNDETAADGEESGTVTVVPDNDDIILETVTNPAWTPIGTSQTGEHVSEYDAESVDYNEKKKAIAYATGFSEDELYYKRVKNGGGPQKSVGIVTTKDGSKIFRVHIDWIDGKGWKPVKMDVLKTLDFDY